MKRASMNMGTFALVGMLILPIGAFAQEAPAETAKSSEGIVHTVVAGDSLWDLSAKYLGSPWKWTEVWERNRFISNPHYIYPGIQVVIVPPGPREIALGQEAASASAPAETVAAVAPPAEAVKTAVPPAVPPVAPPRVPYLGISPGDFVSAGEFLREKPTGIGKIWGGRNPTVGFSQGDLVYLLLDKEIPAGQLLAVYRVRGPIRSSGERPQSGYVKFFIGILQVGRVDSYGQLNAQVRQSFADITRDDLISEEIPSYSPVKIAPGEEGLEATVITGRNRNELMATGDFVYLDRGSDAGVAVGNVFRMVTVTGYALGIPSIIGKRVRSEVAWAAVVRVSREFSTAYVYKSKGAFGAGDLARRGIPAE
jgi:hypothetical protein